MQKTDYKFLSKVYRNQILKGSELGDLKSNGDNSHGGGCPAIMEKDGRMVIVGVRLPAPEVKYMESDGRVRVNVEQEEVAVSISKELFMKAVEEMLATGKQNG